MAELTLPTNKEKVFSLCEAVADIAYIAGEREYYSGNSRQDIHDFIHWAQEFEALHVNIEWGINSDLEYIEAIEQFTHDKLKDK